jgi:hypothetical protein
MPCLNETLEAQPSQFHFEGNASLFRVDDRYHGPYPADHGGQISESHAQASGAETAKGGRRKAEKEQRRELQASSED